PIPGGHVAGVDALDVERAQPFFDQLTEIGRDGRLLHVVFADEEVDRIDGARGDLCSDGGWSQDQNASRMALTIVRAKSVLTRSRAFASCPKNATGSVGPRPVVAS